MLPAHSANLVRAECPIDKVRAEDTMTSRVCSCHDVTMRGLSGTCSSGVAETVNAYRI